MVEKPRIGVLTWTHKTKQKIGPTLGSLESHISTSNRMALMAIWEK